MAVDRLLAARPRWPRLTVAVALLFALLPVALGNSPAAAARAFALRYQANLNGELKLYGSPLLTCSTVVGATGQANCAAIQAGTGGATDNNNGHDMVNLKADASSAGSGLLNSSGLVINLPAGAQVTFAGLYWQAYGPAQSLAGNQLSFRPPGQAAYATVNATTYDTDSGSGVFAGFADVTNTVKAAGNGTYWAGNLAARLGTNTYGGWAVVLVYTLPTLPTRNITVYDGLQSTSATINLSGFLTPPSGPVNAAVGVVAGEGDAGTSGDAATFNGRALTDAVNGASNFFNSSIAEDGVAIAARTPSGPNTLGWDVDRVVANSYLTNSQTSTTLVTSSSGDAFYPQVIATRIDLYAPTFPVVTKSVVDLDATSGSGPAKPGDRLRYTISQTNTGLDPADNVVINDALPANVTYVPGSIQVTAGANAGAKTDASGDDQADYLSGTRTVRTRVGTGANATTGGTLAGGDATTITFLVTVDTAAAGTTIDNAYSMTYVARTLNQSATANSNSASMVVDPVADLSITKSATPNPIVAGASVTYTVTVANAGPSAAAGSTVTDSLPSGVTLVSATPSQGTCTSGSTSCSFGSIASGATATVTYVVTAASSLAAGSLLANSASTATTTLEQNAGNNSTTISTPVTTSANLSVSKTGPATVVPGQNVTWTVTAANAGPSIARSVTVADSLPAGTTLVSATPSTGSCTAAVSCTLGDLAAGASATVTIVARVASSATGSLANTATVSSATNDPSSANNTSTATSTLTPRANLVTAKSANTSPLVAGTPGTWTYTVTNNGASDAQAVTSSDAAPTGVSWTWASTTLGSCSFTATTVSCTHGVVPAGGTVTVTVIGDVASSAAISASNVTNTASAATTTTQTSTADDSASVTTPLVSLVQLEVTKTGTPDPVLAGGSLTYTVRVRNVGPSDATGVTVSDPLPAHTTSAGAPTSTRGTCSLGSGIVSCAIGTLPLGATATVSIPVTVDPGFVGTAVTNTATASSDQTAAQTATFTSTVSQQADLKVTKTAPAGPVVAGQGATWSFVVANDGPSDAFSVTLADTLPAGFTFVSTSTGSCTGTVGAGSVGCSWPTIVAGGSVAFTVTTAVAASAVAGPAANTSTVTGTPTDPTMSNNTSTAVVDVDRSADLSMTKTGPATIDAGTSATYTIGVANAGPSTATDTVIADLLPIGLSFDPATSDPRCSAGGRLVQCTLGTLAPGGTDSVVVGVKAASWLASGSTLANTAQASTTTPEANAANDSATASSLVATKADLSVRKAGPSQVTAGRPATWTVTLTNNGPSDAMGVVLTDTAPAGVTFTSVTSSSSLLGCTLAAVCSAGSGVAVPVGTTITVTLTGDVGAGVTGSGITNSASVTASTADPMATNGSDSVTSPLVTLADLTVTKVPPASDPVAGNAATWTVTVVNAGPSTARTVTLFDTPPTGVTWTSVSTSVGSCSLSTGTCSFGDLAVGATVTIGYTGSLSSAVPGGVTMPNQATVSSPTPDPSPAGNNVAVTSFVGAAADVSVTKSAVASRVFAGDTARWAFTVANAGPSDAQDVMADDSLPSFVDAASVVVESVSQGACTVFAGAVHCGFDTVPSGAMVTVVVSGTVLASTPNATTVTNVVFVSTSTHDTNNLNDVAIASLTTATLAGVSITKTYTGGPLTAGGSTASWQLAVHNSGPSDAAGVQVVDTLPSTVGSVAGTATQGTCTGSPTITCALGAVAAGATVTIDVTAAVGAAHVGPLTNTAVVSTTTPDTTTADDSASVTTPVATSADLAVTKVLDAPVVAGQPASWTVTVTNAGPSVARSAAVTDAAPIGVTWTAATTSIGSCTLASACAFGDLAPGAVATVHLTGTVAAGATGTATNAATASSTTPDPVPSNTTTAVTSPIGTSADLRVTKALDAPITAGVPASWTVTVTNAGPSVARAASVSDVAPSGVSWSAITTSVGTCDTGSGTCAFGDLAVGAAATVHLTGMVDPGRTASVANTAVASSATPDPSPVNSTVTVTSPVATSADLTVTKVADGPLVAGTAAHWTVTVTNHGPSAARAVTVADSAAGAFTLTGLGTSLGSCNLPAATCSLGDLPVDATATVTVTADIAPTTPDGSSPANTATVASSTSDPSGGNNTATAAVAVARVADLSVTKTASGDPAPWTAGQNGIYVLTVHNDGPSASGSSTLTDTLPAGTTFTAFRATSAGLSCSRSGATVTCTFADLAPGASLAVTIAVAIDAGASGPMTNTATVAQTGASDPTAADRTASASAPTATTADVAIDKHPLGEVVAGATQDWQIDVVDHGPSDATTVVVTDTLPAGASWATVPPGCVAVSATSITCALGTLRAGQSATLTGTVFVDADQAAGALANHAEVSSATPDPATSNNAVDVPFTVVRRPVLALAKRADTTTATAGDRATFTLQAANWGPSGAEDVVVTDVLPAGLTFVPARSDPRCAVGAGVVTCTVGHLGANTSALLTVAVDVDPALTGAVVNTATLSTSDPAAPTSVLAASASLSITTAADLAVAKQADGPLVPGTPGSWTVTVTNRGPSVARAVSLADPAPADVTWTAVYASSGTCDLGATCTLGDLAVGATATVHLTGDLAATATGSLANTATASSTTPDPTSANSTATSVTALDPSADLAVVKALDAPLTAGSPGSWTITVTNRGPSVARAVVLDDPAPAGVSWTSATTSVGTCDTVVHCTIGDVAPGTVVTVHVTGTVDAARLAAVVNVASVQSATADPSPGNSTAATTSAVATSADLSTTKVLDAPITAGTPASWTVVVTNAGPSVARSVTVADPAPDGVTWTAAAAGSGSCDLTAACAVGDLAPGASVTVHLTGDVDPAHTAPIANSAVASSPTTDPDPSSGTAIVTAPVRALADLSITKSLTTPAVAGDQASWTIVVVNAGPSTAHAAFVDDAPPAGVTWTAATVTVGWCSLAGRCDLGDLAPGQRATVVFTGQLDAALAPGTIANTATAGTASTDPDGATATSTGPLTVAADLRLDKLPTPGPWTAGTSGHSWTLRLHNAGPSNAGAYTITDVLPAGVDLGAVVLPGGCSLAGATVTCTGSNLLVGATVDYVVGITVLAGGGSLTNTATVVADAPDPRAADDTATSNPGLARQVDLQVTKSGPATIVAGEDGTWTVTVTNAGPSAYDPMIDGDLTVVDALPAGLTAVSAAATDPALSCTTSAATATCAGPASLAPGATVTVTVVAHVDPAAAAGTRTNVVTANIPAPPGGADPATSDNLATQTFAVTRRADLSATKTAVASALTAGSAASWTIAVTNAGPSTAESPQFVDTLPAGFTFLSATGGTCTAGGAGDVVTCTRPGDLAPAAVWTVTLDATIDSDATLGTSTNRVHAASLTTGTTGDAASAVTVGASADVSITKTAVGPLVAGAPARWALTVANAGPSDARNVVVTDVVPAAVTALAAAGPGPCSVSAATVTCSLATLPAGTAATFTVAGLLDATYGASTLANTASVASPTPDPTPGDRTTTATTPVGTAADLRLAKVADPATATAGETATWTLTVVNAGPSTATAVTVTDTLPAGISGGTLAVASGSGSCGATTCTFPSLAVGDVATIVVTGTVDPAQPAGPITNTATVASPVADPDGSSNTATASTTVDRLADLQVTKTGAAADAVAGAPTTWTIAVHNAGPSTATAVTVGDTAPPGVTFTTWSAPLGVTCTLGGGTALACDLGTIGPGATTLVAVTGELDAGAPVGAAVVNTATAASTTPDPAVGNSTGVATASTVGSADVSISKTGPAAVVAGRPAVWTMVVTNRGPSVARSVDVVDALPPAVTLTSLTSTAGTCSGATCTIAQLAPGQAVVVTATGTVSAAAAGQVTNSVSALSAVTPDPAATDNTAAATSAVTVGAVLRVGIVADVASVTAGGTVAYRVSLANDGPSDAVDSTIVVRIPEGLTVDRASLPAGAVLSPDGRTITYVVPALPAGATVSIGYTAMATASVAGPVTVTTDVSATSPSAAPASSELADSAAVVVTPLARLTVTKTADGSSAIVGGSIGWTITLTNAGPSPATAVSLAERLPASLQPGTAAVSTGTWNPQSLVWSVPVLAVGASATLHFATTVGAVGDLTNEVAVESATATAGASTLVASATVVAAPPPDLPRTGVDLRTDLAAAFLLVLVGSAVLLGRRRTTP